MSERWNGWRGFEQWQSQPCGLFFYGSFINLDVLNQAGYVPGGTLGRRSWPGGSFFVIKSREKPCKPSWPTRSQNGHEALAEYPPLRQIASKNVKNLHFPRTPDPLPPFLL